MRTLLIAPLALLLAALTGLTAPAAAEDAAADDWHWHRPVVIDRHVQERPGPGRVHYIPMLARTDAEGTAIATWVFGASQRFETFSLDAQDALQKRHSVPVERPRGRPLVIADGQALWHARADREGDLLLYEFTEADADPEPIRIDLPDADRRVSNLLIEERRMDLIYIERMANTADRYEMKRIRSEDAGDTWSDPNVIGMLHSDDDLAIMPGHRTPDGRWLQYAVDQKRNQPIVFESTDDGKTWSHHDLELADDLEGVQVRIPVQVRVADERWVMVYYAAGDLDTGRYVMTVSDDAGRTWSSGTALTDVVQTEDELATWTTLAMDGDRMAFCHMARDPDEAMNTDVSAHVRLSNDGGRTWRSVDPRQTYRNEPTVTIVNEQPGGGMRFISAVGLGQGRHMPWHYLTVQEWSARPPEAIARPEPAQQPEPDAAEDEPADEQQAAADRERQQRIARLIDDLGAIEYADRQAATEALIEIGGPALESLEKARDSSDPEIADRAEKIIRAIKGVTEGRPDLGPAPEHPMVE